MICSGELSTDGITLTENSNDTFVECYTNHLTSFAVLVDTKGERGVSDVQYV